MRLSLVQIDVILFFTNETIWESENHLRRRRSVYEEFSYGDRLAIISVRFAAFIK